MLRVICKYPILRTTERVFHVSLPLNSEVLSIKQHGEKEIVLYALTDPTETAYKRYSIYTFYTNEIVKEREMENLKFLDTIIVNNITYHFFIGEYQNG